MLMSACLIFLFGMSGWRKLDHKEEEKEEATGTDSKVEQEDLKG